MQEKSIYKGRAEKSDIQARIAAERKRRKDIGLIVILLVVLLSGAIFYKFLVSPIMEKTKYDRFVNEFTESINHSKTNGGITVSMTEGEYTLEAYSGSYVYDTVISCGMGVPYDKDMEGDLVTLSFPNGAKLVFGEGDVEQGIRKGKKGLVIHFVDVESREYQYIYDVGKFATTRRFFVDALIYGGW